MNNNSVSDHVPTIIVAGGTGHLGGLIINHLIKQKARVRALVRSTSGHNKSHELEAKGVEVMKVDFSNHAELVEVCKGAQCIVSAVSGLEDVIIGLQTNLLRAAIEAGVPRFIPSDYSIDFTKLPEGSNRNLDLRRQFMHIIDNSSIQATSVLNGMFTNLLAKEAPVVNFKGKKIMYWGDEDQLLDFTTIDNTAEYTAHAAMDPTTPRFLYIAGSVMSMRQIREAASKVTGKEFRMFRVGGLGMLKTMITITRTLVPQKKKVFPPWQGMQYLHNMLTGLPKFTQLNNQRYPGVRWTSVDEVLAKAVRSALEV